MERKRNGKPFMKPRQILRAAFFQRSPRVRPGQESRWGLCSKNDVFKARTAEELMSLLSAVATAILAVIIISTLYFGRDIFVLFISSSQLRVGRLW